MRRKAHKHISTVVVNRKELKHSAKGSTWKKHKYIKKVGDKYIYADDQDSENTETTDKTNVESDTNETSNNEENKTEKSAIEENKSEEENSPEEFDIEQMAQKVIRGEFGNGADRKELLGESYKEIQNRVNEILLGENYVKKQSSKKTSTAKKRTQTDEGPIKKQTK